jgi:hypothetical protein
MNGLIGIAGVLALLLVAGGLVALLQPGRVSWRWLATCGGLVLLNDALLTNLYGLLPVVLPGDWNWQGKLLALAATLAVASSPAFGWRASGLTLRRAPEGMRPVWLVTGLYVAVFLGLALLFPNEPASAETIAFQLTLPGRGAVLSRRAAVGARPRLHRAQTPRRRRLGGWGAVASCLLFGLAHAFGFSKGAFHFDALTMLMTAGPSFIAVWLALRTRSVLIPVLLHNFGNAVMLVV